MPSPSLPVAASVRVAPTETVAPPAGRLVFLDWIRILAFGLLVLYHVGMYYVSWDWHIKSPHTVTALEDWMRLSAPWRMDLLFLVSGAATAFMLARRGATGAWLASRGKRLGLPLILGVALIVPPQAWFEVADKLGYTGSFAEFMALYLRGYGDFCFAPGRCLILPTWNHLWFLPYLLVYTVLLWLALRAWPGLLERVARWLDVRAGGAGLLLWPVLALALARAALQGRFPDTRALVDDWSAHAHFGAMFLTGAVLARAPGIWPRLARWRWWALALALAAWLLMTVARHGAVSQSGTVTQLLLVLLRSTQQWCAIVAVLGFGFLYLNRDGRLRRYLTQAVFPLYILHQTVILLLAKAMLPLQWQAASEAAVLAFGTLVICLAAFEGVRRIDWLCPWFGLQPMSGAGAAGPVARTRRAG